MSIGTKARDGVEVPVHLRVARSAVELITSGAELEFVGNTLQRWWKDSETYSEMSLSQALERHAYNRALQEGIYLFNFLERLAKQNSPKRWVSYFLGDAQL